MTINRFRAAGISEAVENTQDISKKVKNPFKELKFFLVF